MNPPLTHAGTGAAAADTAFFGHPRGLSTLFFTEMWERFSYYGMRALLILFLTAAPATGGFGLDATAAGSIYGLYTFGVYALALPGGWIADRLIGQRRAVFYGGVLIALGHFSMALASVATFYTGLALIVVGTGLLKPNVSAIVGDLYETGSPRRDAGFSIFYMGINLGAMLGPLVCSYLGEPREGATWVQWHYGFGAAGVGMTLGLLQYRLGLRHLHGAGELKDDSREPARIALAWRQFAIGLAVAVVLCVALWAGASTGAVSLSRFAESVFVLVTALFLVYFAIVLLFVARDRVERQRLAVCLFLCLGAAMFWAGFEQAGSALNLFARDFTDRTLFGTEITSGALQSVNSIFIILLAPVMGWLWVALGSRSPSIPVKFGFGLVMLGVGFLVLAWASTGLAAGKAGMRWLVATYFFHTVGELALSPVGLSSITKLAPARLVGQLMGAWFMGAAIGNLIAGMAARFMPQTETVEEAIRNNVALFSSVAAVVIASGLLFWIFAKAIRRLQAGVD